MLRKSEPSLYLEPRRVNEEKPTHPKKRSNAERLGIDIPDRQNWWANDDAEGNLSPDDTTWWLSEKGRIGLANLIKQERRKDFEWWLKVIAALTGLGGVFIGIISALKR